MKKYKLVIAILVAIISLAGVVYAGTSNLTGWAWSNNVGWISFSSDNAGAASSYPYGVTVSTSSDPLLGTISGYAWASNLGWLSFNQSDVSGCPTDAADTTNAAAIPSGGTACTPRVDFSTGKVNGWARLLTLKNYDNSGWVHLAGSDATHPTGDLSGAKGVTFNKNTGDIIGYAWSSDIGWIDLAAASGVSGNPGVTICTPGTCPVAENITGSCTNGSGGNAIAPGTLVTMSVDASTLQGGSGSYVSYSWNDGAGNTDLTTGPFTNKFRYTNGIAGNTYLPTVEVTDSAGRKSNPPLSCGQVTIQSDEPEAADLRVWIGSSLTPVNLRNVTFIRIKPNQTLNMAWTSTNTQNNSCAIRLTDMPAGVDAFDFDVDGLPTSDDRQIPLSVPGIYKFAMQCMHTDGTMIPTNFEDLQYNGAPIRNKVRVEVTNSDITEI